MMGAWTLPGGLLVVFEGIDGAGKSTQIRRLALLLDALDVDHMLSREPTDGPHGRALRDSAMRGRRSRLEEHELLLADRRQHLQEQLLPALAAGRVVILDRYFYSSIAYQSGPELDAQRIEADNRQFAPEADLLLLLDLDPAQGIERIEARGDRPNAFETRDNLQRCRAIFRSFAARPQARLIDASAHPDAVAAQIAAEVLAAAAIKLNTAAASDAAARAGLMGMLGGKGARGTGAARRARGHEGT